MDKIIDYKIIENTKLNDTVYKLKLSGPTDWIRPGKFLNIKIPGKYLRRPMSVYDWDKKTLTIVYKVFGEGTQILSTLKANEKLEVLIDLGNYFTIPQKNHYLIVAGGCGIGSVYSLAKKMNASKIEYTTVIGFKNKQQSFLIDELKKFCKNLLICTEDGSLGFKGNVIDVINKHKLNDAYYFVCGSTPLMQAVFKTCKEGQLSLEARMGCGFGCCMGCSIQTKSGDKRICREGPIFSSGDLLW